MGLKTILLGGLEFDVFDAPGEVAKDGSEFTLYPDRTTRAGVGSARADHVQRRAWDHGRFDRGVLFGPAGWVWSRRWC